MDELRRELESATPDVWPAVERRALVRRYEADGGDAVFEQARRAYDERLAACEADSRTLTEYGYLWECRAVFALRRAAAELERAIDADPEAEKPRLQLIQVRARLLEGAVSVEEHRRRVAEHAGDAREHRLLVAACLASNAYADAEEAVRAALARFPDDAALVGAEARVLESTGRPEQALERYERAARLEPEDAGPLFGRALLLQRLGRRDEAAATWRTLVDWLGARGYDVEAEWPRRELARLEEPGR